MSHLISIQAINDTPTTMTFSIQVMGKHFLLSFKFYIATFLMTGKSLFLKIEYLWLGHTQATTLSPSHRDAIASTNRVNYPHLSVLSQLLIYVMNLLPRDNSYSIILSGKDFIQRTRVFNMEIEVMLMSLIIRIKIYGTFSALKLLLHKLFLLVWRSEGNNRLWVFNYQTFKLWIRDVQCQGFWQEELIKVWFGFWFFFFVNLNQFLNFPLSFRHNDWSHIKQLFVHPRIIYRIRHLFPKDTLQVWQVSLHPSTNSNLALKLAAKCWRQDWRISTFDLVWSRQ